MLNILYPFNEQNWNFLNRLLDYGEITPEHITDNESLAECIRNHPGLRWKALNVNKYKSSGNL